MWRLDRTGHEPQFFDTEDAAIAYGATGEHVIWFDSFDYELHNRGRAA
jgi:hypothetical protein